MNVMPAREEAKDAKIATLEQKITGLIAAAADHQKLCNNTTPQNKTIEPEAKPEEYKNGGRYSFYQNVTAHYCWTHRKCFHQGRQCDLKVAHHKDEATASNNMGVN